ncbi:hypothetical protein OG225_09875 [Nocardia sp. NBC_01377]|uniref:hypothetical protein n=1 Tax=Nocardia sp. NBC_01377 TaxID=2903595 RepID=UPI003246C58D
MESPPADTAPQTPALTYRAPTEDDHARVPAVLDRWWGGLGGDDGARQRAGLLPRLFFQHFTEAEQSFPGYDGPGTTRVTFVRVLEP